MAWEVRFNNLKPKQLNLFPIVNSASKEECDNGGINNEMSVLIEKIRVHNFSLVDGNLLEFF
jgi:hypothetical protein